MVVTRWEPLKDLMALQERMDKLFDETVSKGTQDQEAGIWFLAVDIMERRGMKSSSRWRSLR
jgi:HSP20 family protein